MLRGLYTAGSAMVTNSKRIDVVSNNLANISTNAFKKDVLLNESFEDVLVMKRNGYHKNTNYSTEGFTHKEFDGFHSLNSPNAFIKLDGKTELSYNRAAELHVDKDGYLSTYYKDGNGDIYPDRGNRVYGQNGHIQVGEKELTFDESGNVLLDGVISDNILFIPPPNVIGTVNSGVRVDRTETLFEQGQLERTDYEYDLAIDGDGFFEVETPSGNMLTRDGRFKLNSFGEIVTMEGHKLVGLDGPIEMLGEHMQVNHFGEVIIDGEVVDKVSVKNIDNKFNLEKRGAGLFTVVEGKELIENEFDGAVRQGYVEKSNAENLKEMISLMELYRNYESNQRMVKAYDVILDKAVNQIGRL